MSLQDFRKLPCGKEENLVRSIGNDPNKKWKQKFFKAEILSKVG